MVDDVGFCPAVKTPSRFLQSTSATHGSSKRLLIRNQWLEERKHMKELKCWENLHLPCVHICFCQRAGSLPEGLLSTTTSIHSLEIDRFHERATNTRRCSGSVLLFFIVQLNNCSLQFPFGRNVRLADSRSLAIQRKWEMCRQWAAFVLNSGWTGTDRLQHEFEKQK